MHKRINTLTLGCGSQPARGSLGTAGLGRGKAERRERVPRSSPVCQLILAQSDSSLLEMACKSRRAPLAVSSECVCHPLCFNQ